MYVLKEPSICDLSRSVRKLVDAALAPGEGLNVQNELTNRRDANIICMDAWN